MDSIKLILTEDVQSPTRLMQLRQVDVNGASEQRKKQLAKDFESLLINKLLDEMKNTIGDWGFDKDGAGKQIHGIFWFYLAQEIANKGGFGLWTDVYRSLTNSNHILQTNELLDKSI